MGQREIIYTSISLTDLKSVGFTVDIKTVYGVRKVGSIKFDGKKVKLKKLLWMFGIRDNEHFSVDDLCQHVCKDGSTTMNYRLTGQERTDRDWLDSGHASDEAHLDSCKMGDMVGYASTLRNGGDSS